MSDVIMTEQAGQRRCLLSDGLGSICMAVILKTPHGSRLRFADNGSGVYTAYPGVWITLTRSTYVFTYSTDGRNNLLATRDARGTTTSYT